MLDENLLALVLGLSRRSGTQSQRGLLEPGMAGSGPTKKKNDLLELGNSNVRDGSTVHVHSRQRKFPLVPILLCLGQQANKLLDAFKAGSRFLHGILFQLGGEAVGAAVGDGVSVTHEINGHV
ncbi:hypothetical protein PS1_034944 [Malus domestica]